MRGMRLEVCVLFALSWGVAVNMKPLPFAVLRAATIELFASYLERVIELLSDADLERERELVLVAYFAAQATKPVCAFLV